MSDRRRRTKLLVAAIFVAVVVTVIVAVAGGSLSGSMRQADIADRGAQVMPFDLERTTHIFEPLDDGGVQSVVADNPSDAEQVELVRMHLQEEAEKFRRGDFEDPATIHGDAMPGLDALRASAGEIDVRYGDTPDGAEIRYTTSDPILVAALGDWFEAQLSDHGSDATDHGS